MAYKLDFSDIDMDAQARIKNSLELNIEALDIFNGLYVANWDDDILDNMEDDI